LIARLAQCGTDSLNGDFDFVAKFCSQLFDFMGTGHDSVDSYFDTQFGEPQDLVIHFAGDADFAQRCSVALVKTVTPRSNMLFAPAAVAARTISLPPLK